MTNTRMRRLLVRVWCICFLCCLFLTGTRGVWAQNAADGTGVSQEPGHVTDDAGLLTDTQRAGLQEAITEAEQQTGWDLYAVTTLDAGGKSAQAYADDFFDSSSGGGSGVVLLIDMDNREIYISTAGEAIRYLTDRRIDTILDNAYGYVSEGDYADCFSEMLSGVVYAYEQGIPDGQYNYDVETGKISVYRSVTPLEAVIAVLVALVAGIGVFAVIVGRYRLKFGGYTYDCHRFGSVNVTDEKDVLVNTVVTHRRIPRNTGGSGGGGSRSSVHTRSSGARHGGGGRKF